jgi:hypothetical protein
LKPTERRKYWRQVTQIQLKYQRKYKPLIERELKDQVKRFIENRNELWNEGLMNVLGRLHREVTVAFASLQYKRLRVVTQKLTMGFNAKWTQEVNDWLSVYGLNLVSTITNSQRERIEAIINDVIQEGVVEGWGADFVTREIEKRLIEFGRIGNNFIAERIARTETLRAANIGHMKGASEHNFYVKKIWISAKDNRTRQQERNDEFDHWDLDGQEREMNELYFQIGRTGKIANAMQPGDESAPAAFTINCRCTIAFEAKRDSNGRIIMKK